MAANICRRSAWGINGQILPDEVSQNRVIPCTGYILTQSVGEEAVWWVSTWWQNWPAAAVVDSDPVGSFTQAGITAAKPRPGREDDDLDKVSPTRLSVPMMCRMSLENSAI